MRNRLGIAVLAYSQGIVNAMDFITATAPNAVNVQIAANALFMMGVSDVARALTVVAAVAALGVMVAAGVIRIAEKQSIQQVNLATSIERWTVS